MDCDLAGRVTGVAAIAALAAALLAALVAGGPGALGVAAGAAVALASFRWIARGSRRAAAVFAGGRPGALWVLGLGLRHLTLFGVMALCLASGLAHPLGLVAGLSLLPPVLILSGLRAASRAG
jgi:hypothetical protein